MVRSPIGQPAIPALMCGVACLAFFAGAPISGAGSAAPHQQGTGVVVPLSSSPKPSAPRFTLGVLRHDGLLLPFASFDRRRWEAPWPPSTFGLTLPISLADVPAKWWGAVQVDTPWTAWLPDGTTRPLALEKPGIVPVFCANKLAVSTNYPGGPFNPREPTSPKDALGVAGNAPLQTITEVSVHAPDARHLIDLMADAFNAEEQRAVSRFTEWTHPFGAARRKQFPIALEAIYRAHETTPRGSWMTTYVEAVRKFPAQPGENGCGLITFVRGWITEAEGKKPVINIGARVVYCDRANVSFMLPLGRVLLEGDAYWIYQISSWRDEAYTITRVRPDGTRPVLVVNGGACLR